MNVPATPFCWFALFAPTDSIAKSFMKRRERLKFYKLLLGE